jgi:hypothetical protein
MPQFNIVRIIPGEKPQLWCLEPDRAAVLANGEEAAAMAAQLTETTGVKHQPRPIKSNKDWRAREQERFAQGTYRALPWANEPWAVRATTIDHFAHVSLKDQSKIAFTENEAKGDADVQTQMKAGRYLSAFFGTLLDSEAIKHWATSYAAEYGGAELLFAKTANEIEEVYTGGVSSCMGYEASAFDSPCHPTRVYAGPDLAIAYCENEHGRVAARALCWPEKKKYGRIYGDHYRLENLLSAEGYSHSCDFTGARMTLIDHGRGYVCPYIDFHDNVGERDGFLVVGLGYESCQNTNGLTCEEGPICPRCEESYDESASSYIEDRGEYWCEDCASNDAYICEATSALFARRDSVVFLSDGTCWSRDYFDRHGAECEECNQSFSADDMSNANRCESCQTAHDEDEDEDKDEAQETDEAQAELPGPEGTVYRIRITNSDSGPYVCFDGLDQHLTTDWQLVLKTLAEMRALYPPPRTIYTVEHVAIESTLAA